MEPFDFTQDRLRGIQEACAGNPGFHPGYNKDLYPSKSLRRTRGIQWSSLDEAQRNPGHRRDSSPDYIRATMRVSIHQN